MFAVSVYRTIIWRLTQYARQRL